MQRRFSEGLSVMRIEKNFTADRIGAARNRIGRLIACCRVGSVFQASLILLIVVGFVGVAHVEPADTAKGAARFLQARGVVRPAQQARITADLIAPLAKAGFREGQKFRKGDLLLAFDCRRQLAELASAMAQQREMAVVYESAAFLEKRKAGSRQDMEMSRARSEKAAAEVEAIRARTEQCNVVAPYDGHVVELGIQAHELPVAGKSLLFIVSTGDPEVELIVPSLWLSWLQVGVEFKFAVDETQNTYVGKIARLGASVDAVSQTVKVYGKFAMPPADILPGMSGTIQFPRLQS